MTLAMLGAPTTTALPTQSRETVVGRWRQVCSIRTDSAGKQSHTLGEHPLGRIMFTADGHMAAQLYSATRPKLGAARFKGDPEAARAAFSGLATCFGRYSVDSVAHTVTHAVEGTDNPEWRGSRDARLASDWVASHLPRVLALSVALRGTALLALLASGASAQGTAVSARDSLAADSARQRLGTVLITGTRLTAADLRTPSRVGTLDLLRAPAGPGSAIDALVRLEGLSLFDEAGSRLQPALQVRGFTLSPIVGAPQGVGVFLNGVRVNEPDAQEVHFDLLPMAAIEAASLVRGANVLHGRNSLGGTLLLRTRRGDAPYGSSLTLGLGSFGSQVATLTAGGAARGMDVFVAATASDETGWRDATSANTRNLFATAGWQFGSSHDSGDVALDLHYARDLLYQAGSLPADYLTASPRLNYTAGDLFKPQLFAATLRGNALIGGGIARATLWVRRNAYRQFNGNIPPPDTDSDINNRSAGFTAEWTRPVAVGTLPLALTIGAEYQRDHVGFRLTAVGGGAADSLTTLAEVRQDNFAAYVQAVLSLAPTVDLTAGFRADDIRVPYRDQLNPTNDGTNSFIRGSPEVGVTWRPRAGIRAYAAYKGGFRAPAPLELACASPTAPCSLPSALGADPALEPVTTDAWEAGVDVALDARTNVELGAFWTEVANDIHIASPSLTQVYFVNVPRTRRAGVELSARTGLPAGARLFATYGYLAATFESAVQLATVDTMPRPTRPGGTLPASPAHRARVGVGITRALGAHVLDGEFDLRAVSSQFLRGDEANQRDPLPGYAIAGARVAIARGRFRLALHVDNLFDRRHDTFGILARNLLGVPGSTTPPVNPPVEAFRTPGHARRLMLFVTANW